MSWEKRTAPGEKAARLNVLAQDGVELIVYAHPYNPGSWLMTLKRDKLVLAKQVDLDHSSLSSAKEEAVQKATTVLKELEGDIRNWMSAANDGE